MINETLIVNIYEQGFIPNYYWWTNHGKELPQFHLMVVKGSYYGSDDYGSCSILIGGHIENMEENPNPKPKKFFAMLVTAQVSLWEGCDNHLELSILFNSSKLEI
ncbi:hypothetical protein CR513_32592, partial [Mucuna pruriens]